MGELGSQVHEFTCLYTLCPCCYCLQLVYLYMWLFISPFIMMFLRYKRRTLPHIEEAIKNLNTALRTFEKCFKSVDDFTLQQNTELINLNDRIQSLVELLSSCIIKSSENDSLIDTCSRSEDGRTINETTITMEKTPSIIPVQVYRKEGKGIKNEFVDELLNHLNDDLTTKIQFEVCNSVDQIDYERTTLVLCLTNSRLGSDAVNAIRGIDAVQKNVALLVCHHQEIHALPTTPSAARLTESRFSGIGGIYDIAFTSEKGLYPCDMNTQAKKKIVDFVFKNS